MLLVEMRINDRLIVSMMARRLGEIVAGQEEYEYACGGYLHDEKKALKKTVVTHRRAERAGVLVEKMIRSFGLGKESRNE